MIIQINNQTYIDSPDDDRIIRDRDDVYYEELPRGRIREVVTRPNGVRIVTIRNRYGDIIRRSRIEPDNREVILVYVEDRYYQDEGNWRDPGLDLPPMRLTIPREEYILDAEYVEDDDLYYDFLEQPPVERVERTYSLTEVKRSARIRDKVRRIDMDTLTFEFGSASIAESEIPKLEGVANAMEKLLAKNPAETFLLEGHTDAVGSDTRQSGAFGQAGGGGRRGAHQRVRHSSGKPRHTRVRRAVSEGEYRAARARKQACRHPPRHAAGGPGRQRQLS